MRIKSKRRPWDYARGAELAGPRSKVPSSRTKMGEQKGVNKGELKNMLSEQSELGAKLKGNGGGHVWAVNNNRNLTNLTVN